MAEIQTIPCFQILADPLLNVSRTNMTPASCQDIAASIEVHGLQTPVTVRPLEADAAPFVYELVLGFRRFTATTINLGRDSIECIIREMTREEAMIMNVIENLQRSDLTFWEQANALQAAFPAEMQMQDVATQVGYSKDWVRLRWKLRELPKSIQEQVRAGLLGAADIGIILQQSKEDRIRAANKLKSGKAAGKTIKDLQRELTGRKNHRSKKEVKAMMTRCMEGGHLEAVHALRYACGEVSDTLLLELLDPPE